MLGGWLWFSGPNLMFSFWNRTIKITVVHRFSRHRFSRKFQFDKKFEKIAATNLWWMVNVIQLGFAAVSHLRCYFMGCVPVGVDTSKAIVWKNENSAKLHLLQFYLKNHIGHFFSKFCQNSMASMSTGRK